MSSLQLLSLTVRGVFKDKGIVNMCRITSWAVNGALATLEKRGGAVGRRLVALLRSSTTPASPVPAAAAAAIARGNGQEAAPAITVS
jgi:hypothetical protein